MRLRRTAGGFTLLEIMIAISIIVLSIIGLVSVITYTTQQNEINRENLLAMRAAEGKVEEMRQYAVEEIFARYSATATTKTYLPSPANGLAGLFPGPDFSDIFDRSKPTTYDPTYQRIQGAKGYIIFPWETSVLVNDIYGKLTIPTPGNPIHLKEDQTDPDPITHDLNGNAAIDDPTLDYVILPVKIVVEWSGIKGKRTITYKYMFLKKT